MSKWLRSSWRFLRYGDEPRFERDMCDIFDGHRPKDYERDLCLGCNSTRERIWYDGR
jgi:hypothetical protein